MTKEMQLRLHTDVQLAAQYTRRMAKVARMAGCRRLSIELSCTASSLDESAETLRLSTPLLTPLLPPAKVATD